MNIDNILNLEYQIVNNIENMIFKCLQVSEKS
jgi:hypothetical protein